MGFVKNLDNQSVAPEDNVSLPWIFDPENTWLDYRCALEVRLDAGLALHKPLPQQNPAFDTLASVELGTPDQATNGKLGVNLLSTSKAVDVIQRMASSTYTFVLRGFGLRVGYQVPVPGLVSVGDQTAYPVGEQYTSGNVLVGNMIGGIPVFYCEWELPYAVTQAPNLVNAPVPPNPALHINADVQLPIVVLLPSTPIDQNATQVTLPTLVNG